MQWYCACLGNRLYPSLVMGGIAHGDLACVQVKLPGNSREVGSFSIVNLVSYFCTLCFSQYDILQRSSQVECFIFCQWQVEAEWYTLWRQEFLANWNLLLVIGPRSFHKKIIVI